MTEKTKKGLVIAAACILCLALAVGISLRFANHSEAPSDTNPTPTQDTTEPVVNIQGSERPDPTAPVVTDPNTDNPEGTGPVVDITVPDKTPAPSEEVGSTGTEQVIQPDPVKPEAPEKPAAPSTTPLPENHQAEDVPQEDRNKETPPSYQPEQTTVTPTPRPDMQGGYDQGGTYVPGFGYIESSGEGTVIHDDKIYENGNKVGSMD